MLWPISSSIIKLNEKFLIKNQDDNKVTSPANCDDKNDIKEQLLNGEVHHHYNHHLHTHNLQQHLNHQQPSPNRLKDTNKNSQRIKYIQFLS